MGEEEVTVGLLVVEAVVAVGRLMGQPLAQEPVVTEEMEWWLYCVTE
jgi:hypothetical protein